MPWWERALWVLLSLVVLYLLLAAWIIGREFWLIRKEARMVIKYLDRIADDDDRRWS